MPAPARSALGKIGHSNVGRTFLANAESQLGLTGLFRIVGVTQDSAGAALGNCVVNLFRTRDNLFIGSTISDGSGNYGIVTKALPQEQFFVEAYLIGAPDRAGTGVNTLLGGAI